MSTGRPVFLKPPGTTGSLDTAAGIRVESKLNFRRKGKQRLPVRNPSPLVTPEALNQSWFMGFVFARSMLLMTVIVKRCRLKSI